MMGLQEYISRCWNGKEKLWRVFWYWFVAFPVVMGFAIYIVIEAFYLTRFIEEWLHYILIALFVYGPWVLVSMWRCAFNVEWKPLGYLTRIWVLVFSIVSIVLFSSPFWLPWLYGVGY